MIYSTVYILVMFMNLYFGFTQPGFLGKLNMFVACCLLFSSIVSLL